MSLSRYWRVVFPRLWNMVLQRMMTCDGKYRMEQIELVPRWENEYGETIMTRRFIFRSPEELIRYCKEHNPHTLQMGGVFPVLFPELEDKQSREMDRELHRKGVLSLKSPFVVDIDVDDYDRSEICTCPRGHMCVVCWEVCIHSARLIVDYLLRNIFKLRRIMHFWSGRRGVHIWCFDERAFEWTKQERTNVLNVLKRRDLCLHVLPEHLQSLRWPRFDEAVSTDPGHCTGIPLGPHHATGAIRCLLPPLASNEKFDPEKQLRVSHVSRVDMFDLDRPVSVMRQMMDE